MSDPTFTAQQLDDLHTKWATIQANRDIALYRYAAGLVEENQRLKADNTEFYAAMRSNGNAANTAEAALTALRAVIQQELDRELNGFAGPCEIAGSLGRIVHAAGLWPKGEQAPPVYTDVANP